MLKQWYKFERYNLTNEGKDIDYRYYYVCFPHWLRKGVLNGNVIHEHRLRLGLSVMKVPGRKLPILMHISFPFGFWYGSGSLQRTPIAK